MAKGRSYRAVIENGVNRLQFILEQEAKAPKRKPKRVSQKQKTGTLFAIRNKRVAIREAALRNVQIIITYRKATTGEVNKYVVAPYEWKYLRSKTGMKKVLYAYDMKDRHIKSFIFRNVRNVAITDRKFRPKWIVKIS